MDMHTELKAVPHAGLGFHFLRVPVGNQRSLGVFKRKGGPKRKATTKRQSDVVARKSAELTSTLQKGRRVATSCVL